MCSLRRRLKNAAAHNYDYRPPRVFRLAPLAPRSLRKLFDNSIRAPGNDLVWRKFTFPAVTTQKIRVLASASPDGYSRLAEVEAYEAGAAGRRCAG